MDKGRREATKGAINHRHIKYISGLPGPETTHPLKIGIPQKETSKPSIFRCCVSCREGMYCHLGDPILLQTHFLPEATVFLVLGVRGKASETPGTATKKNRVQTCYNFDTWMVRKKDSKISPKW